MSFRNIQTKSDVAQYQDRLTQGYPDRSIVIEHIIEQLTNLNIKAPIIAELCVGPGLLATALCQAFPQIHYVGLDFMQPFLDFTSNRLPADVNTAFVHADLTGDKWPNLLAQQAVDGRFHAIVSMQSLHDVGGAEEVERIYHHCRGLLVDDGLSDDTESPIKQRIPKNSERIPKDHHELKKVIKR